MFFQNNGLWFSEFLRLTETFEQEMEFSHMYSTTFVHCMDVTNLVQLILGIIINFCTFIRVHSLLHAGLW